MSNNNSLPDKLLENRIIVIYGYIDSVKATEIINNLLILSNFDEEEEIKLYFSSSGGSYLDVLAIYDTMQSIPNPISGTCIGMVNGYAALLLANCTKGKRYCLTHSEISLEQPYTVIKSGSTQQTEIAIEAREVTIQRDIMESILVRCTKQDAEKIHNDLEVGITLNANQAIDYGMIDEIL